MRRLTFIACIRDFVIGPCLFICVWRPISADISTAIYIIMRVKFPHGLSRTRLAKLKSLIRASRHKQMPDERDSSSNRVTFLDATNAATFPLTTNVVTNVGYSSTLLRLPVGCLKR